LLHQEILTNSSYRIKLKILHRLKAVLGDYRIILEEIEFLRARIRDDYTIRVFCLTELKYLIEVYPPSKDGELFNLDWAVRKEKAKYFKNLPIQTLIETIDLLKKDKFELGAIQYLPKEDNIVTASEELEFKNS